MNNIFNVRNVCIFFGIIFGLLIYIYYVFCVPSVILLILGGIQTFEYSIKKKKHFEEHLNFKLKNYEEEAAQLKKDCEKIKSEFESFKTKMNLVQMYGKS